MLFGFVSNGLAQSTPPTIAEIQAERAAGNFKQAAESLIRLDEQSELDLSVEFVLTARAAKGKLGPELVDELFARAVRSLDRGAATGDSIAARSLIRTVAATHFIGRAKTGTAAAILVDALDETADKIAHLPAGRGRQLVSLCIRTGWTELNAGHPESAEELYARLVDLAAIPAWEEAVSSDRTVALLGLGWATAMQPDKSQQAAERLQRFVDTFPSHADVAKAAAMRIHCLNNPSAAADRDQAIAEFLRRWPNSEHAFSIALNALTPDVSNQSEAIRSALENWIVVDGDPQHWPTALVSRGLVFAGSKLPPARFDALLRRLASQDETGQETAVLLHESSQSGSAAIAEQVAATLISGDLKQATAMSRESACRWAGRTGRWTMLALAADSTDLSIPDDRRTEHVERLFAEALTQTGQGAKAVRWWAHLVDQRGASDFATLLRCAETTVAHGQISEATERLERTRRALENQPSQTDAARTALVDLLAADLSIRRVDFAGARGLLENVVRNPGSSPQLSGRAQWMIGETHFMQRQFRQAIDAYRKVEGLDPGGAFVSASLVQAGKSFEQLGLTREAGDCYSALLGRFAESPHASEARRRMAALPTARGLAGHGTGSDSDTGPPQSNRLRR